jgi:hypothetical protein
VFKAEESTPMYVIKIERKSRKPERKRPASYFIIKIERKHHAVFFFCPKNHHPHRERNPHGKTSSSNFPNQKTSAVRHASIVN